MHVSHTHSFLVCTRAAGCISSPSSTAAATGGCEHLRRRRAPLRSFRQLLLRRFRRCSRRLRAVRRRTRRPQRECGGRRRRQVRSGGGRGREPCVRRGGCGCDGTEEDHPCAYRACEVAGPTYVHTHAHGCHDMPIWTARVTCVLVLLLRLHERVKVCFTGGIDIQAPAPGSTCIAGQKCTLPC